MVDNELPKAQGWSGEASIWNLYFQFAPAVSKYFKDFSCSADYFSFVTNFPETNTELFVEDFKNPLTIREKFVIFF